MATLKNQKGFEVDVVRFNFADTLRYFDLEQHKEILMIYLAKTNVDPHVAQIIEQKVLNVFARIINEEFAFTAILDNSPEIEALNELNLPPLEHSAFIFVTYDVCDKLTLLKIIDLDDTVLDNTEEIIPNLFEDAFNLGQKLQQSDKDFVTNLQIKREEHENSVSQGTQFSPQGQNFDFDQQSIPGQAPSFNKTFSYDRRMKSEQDKMYQRLIEQQKENLRKKEEEAERMAQEKLKQEQLLRKKELVKEKFLAQEGQPGPHITICFRLPNGRRENLVCLKETSVGDLMEYVTTLDNKGFNNEDSGCELLHGFPPKPLDSQASLLELFHDSEQELFHVKEILKP